MAALLVAGAFAAFLSTSSGLTVAVAGVISQDVVSRKIEGVAAFRLAAVVAILVPFVLAQLADDVGVATAVGLAFAVAASTFCPLLVLGIWWPRLTAPGAFAGLVIGGATSGFAVVRTFLTAGSASDTGWMTTLLAQPALGTVPTFVRDDGDRVSTDTGSRPKDVTIFMVRLHTPEAVSLQRGQ